MSDLLPTRRGRAAFLVALLVSSVVIREVATGLVVLGFLGLVVLAPASLSNVAPLSDALWIAVVSMVLQLANIGVRVLLNWRWFGTLVNTGSMPPYSRSAYSRSAAAKMLDRALWALLRVLAVAIVLVPKLHGLAAYVTPTATAATVIAADVLFLWWARSSEERRRRQKAQAFHP